MKIEDIVSPDFLKTLNNKELETLSEKIRGFLIEKVSKTGGHLSSNLGVIDLTIAIHKVFNSPRDKIIFDVSHQSYTHKILTGRANKFDSLRKFDGLSGFTKRNESEHDPFEAGHSSTSISAQAGFEISKNITNEEYKTISVIGDGSINCGLAFEGLNFLGQYQNNNPIIILNDNNMSISKNVGGIQKLFKRIRSRKLSKIRKTISKMSPGLIRRLFKRTNRSLKAFINKSNIFDDLGYMYLGPINGHNYKQLIKTLEFAKIQNRPVLIHVLTTKGKGYTHAENDFDGKYHGLSSFNIKTGKKDAIPIENYYSWSEVISHSLIKLAEKDEKIVAITPAMSSGSKLNKFRDLYEDRFFDVGIAESHAAVMVSSMAMMGLKPFLSMYSTFAQRAYDQIIHDIARQNTNVVLGIDRSGFVGKDGDTHQGIYDIPLLRHIPNLAICAPYNAKEAYSMLRYCIYDHNGPIAIKYPRGDIYFDKSKEQIAEKIELGSFDILREGKSIIIISFSSSLDLILETVNKYNIDAMVINARFIKPLDEDLLKKVSKLNIPFLIYEESIIAGGLGSSILEFFNKEKIQNDVTIMGVDDSYVEHGDIDNLRKKYKLDKESLRDKCFNLI